MPLTLFSLSGLFLAIISLIIVSITLIFGKTKLSYVWALFKLVAFTWGIAVFLIGKASSDTEALFWWRLGHIVTITSPLFFIYVVYTLCEIKINKVFILAHFYTILFLSLLFSNQFITKITFIFDSLYYIKATNFIYVFFFFCWSFFVLYSIYQLIKAYHYSSGIKRLQISYLLLGSATWITGCLITFLPAFWVKIYPVGAFFIAVDCFLSTYAILKYRVIDLRVAIIRAVVFTFVYALILTATFYLAHNQKLWISSSWNLNSIWLAVTLASAAPFAFIYLRRRAEELILREQLLYHTALREISSKMTRIRNLDELLKTISTSMVDSIKISWAAIYLKEENYNSYQLKSFFPVESRLCLQELLPTDHPSLQQLVQRKKPLLSEETKGLNLASGIIVPFIIDEVLLGFIILGQKKNGQAYTPDDLLVFENFSYSGSLAIENCRFWKEIEDKQRKARLQEMDTYSYSLAHEIDNPMQVILGEGWLLKNEVLKDLPEGEKQKEAGESFDYIIEAAKRVSGMVKAIRDFGQATSGELKPINIDEVAESFSKLYYPRLRAKTVVFEKTSELKEPVLVNGEKPSLMQVLVILANNAVQAMEGAKEKKIILRLSTLNDDWVRVAMSDNGCGIKPEMLSVIFTPFTTTKASSQGTGMGLYNAKMIIEFHKGRIWAESGGTGQGSTFIIELPIARKSG